MRNNFRKIIKYFNPYSLGGGEPRIQRDWLALLSLLAGGLFLGACLGAYTYFNVARIMEKEVVLPESSVVSISKSSIKDIMEDINNKEKKFNEGFVIEPLRDPSL